MKFGCSPEVLKTKWCKGVIPVIDLQHIASLNKDGSETRTAHLLKKYINSEEVYESLGHF